jgi:hypothetical protein
LGEVVALQTITHSIAIDYYIHYMGRREVDAFDILMFKRLQENILKA